MNVLLYTDDFLSRSMTFIYGPLQQIAGVDGINIRVACANRLNAELYPYPSVHILPSSGPWRHLLNRLLRKVGLSFTPADSAFEETLELCMKEQRVDMVHAHFGPCGLRVYPVARKLAVPLLVTFHGYDASTLLRKHAYVREVQKMMEDPAVYGVTVSANMKEVLAAHGINVERTVHHYNGIDTTFFDPGKVDVPKRPRPFTFLQISNLVEKKGHYYSLMAFAQVVKTDAAGKADNAKLVLAGDGPLRPKLRNVARRLKLEGQVSFIGPVNRIQVRELLTQADVFVHHSVTAASGDQEGLPVAITEAMAMGLPILSTHHAGIDELVRTGIDGILVDEKDIGAYSQAMRQMLNGGLSRHNPESSRQRACDLCDLQQHATRLAGIYSAIAKASAGEEGVTNALQ